MFEQVSSVFGGSFGSQGLDFSSPAMNITGVSSSIGGGLTQSGASGLDPMGLAFSGLGVLENLIDFDIIANVGNVLKYGLSSWGASTTPEKMQPLLAKDQNTLTQLAKRVQSGDIPNSLNILDRHINWGYQYHARMRRDHSRAKSTKLAHESARDFYLKMKNQLLVPIKNALLSKGIILEQKVSRKVTDIAKDSDGGTSPERDPAVDYSIYTVNQSKMAELLKKNQPKTIVNGDASNPSASTASMGGLGVLLLAFAGWKFLKK
tara:strand:+ start:2941 stop:3729 length:789 start_codon:yes stop_codon:yes gene_type:complete